MAQAREKKPNILVIWGDDIGISNLSCYSHGLMGYQTPNIDRLAKEGMMFTDSYGEQSCTAGRSSFITGQSVYRTGLSKVGIPAAPQGLQPETVTIADLLKDQGYATGQFGKNHLGDRDEFLHRGERGSRCRGAGSGRHTRREEGNRVVPVRPHAIDGVPGWNKAGGEIAG